MKKWRSPEGFEALGEPPGAKMPQGADWDVLGAPFGGLLERILAPRWAKLEPRWRYVVQLGAKMCPRGRTWSLLGALLGASWRLFLYLGGDLSKMGEIKKTTIVHHFEGFFGSGGLSEAMLAHLGAMLGRLGAILEQLGDEMWTESAKMSQDSGQEHQDEARWREWAARERNWEPQGGSNGRRGHASRGGASLRSLQTGDSRLRLQLELETPTPTGSPDSDCKRNWMIG